MLTLLSALFIMLKASATQPSLKVSEAVPVGCACDSHLSLGSCGVKPAIMSKKDEDLAHALGFYVPGDHDHAKGKLEGKKLITEFVRFLESSDRTPLIYPEYYTRKTKQEAELTLSSTFKPKNPTETDEYLRCTIPGDKYCLYRKGLKPYIGLAAKASGIPYSFLACQSYVESRFISNAKSGVGALGYAQIKPSNVEYLNKVLEKSMKRMNHDASRSIASVDPGSPRASRIRKIQEEIVMNWRRFWDGTKKAPKKLQKCDLTCYRQVFLAQALSLKADMLTLATSSSGLKADFDDNENFRIEGMDRYDSLLLLAGSYNIGVTNMIRLVSTFCSGSTKLKDCLDRMRDGKFKDANLEAGRDRNVKASTGYIMRIRDCSQRFSAEKIDFDDDSRWSDDKRTEKLNQQRDNVVQCLLRPCPL